MSEDQTKIEAEIKDDDDPSVKAEVEKVEAERKVGETIVAKVKDIFPTKKTEPKTKKRKVKTSKSHGLSLAKENEHNEEAAAHQGDPKTCYNDSKSRTTSSNKG